MTDTRGWSRKAKADDAWDYLNAYSTPSMKHAPDHWYVTLYFTATRMSVRWSRLWRPFKVIALGWTRWKDDE